MKRMLKALILGCLILACTLALAETINPALDAALQMAQIIDTMAEPTAQGESSAAWTDSRTGGTCALDFFEDEEGAAAWLEEMADERAFRVLGYVFLPDDALDEEALTAYRAALIQAAGVDYVLNDNTKKFHDPTCFSVEEMKDSNRSYFVGEREDLVEQGYKPCKRCNP